VLLMALSKHVKFQNNTSIQGCLVVTCAGVLAYNDNVQAPADIQGKETVDTVLCDYAAHYKLEL
jgi:hypothetical protein